MKRDFAYKLGTMLAFMLIVGIAALIFSFTFLAVVRILAIARSYM